MGVLQFFPQEIFAHERNQCDLEMRMSYSPWRRNPQEFYDHITKILDLLLDTAHFMAAPILGSLIADFTGFD